MSGAGYGAVNIPGFIDAIQVIFSGHTASGGDMNTLRLGIDGISQATPLDTFKTSVRAGHSVELVIDQRNRDVRQQDGKSHAVRIAAETADQPD